MKQWLASMAAAIFFFGGVIISSKVPAQAPPSPATGQDSLAQALGFIREAKRNYQTSVRDYTCIFVTKEVFKGKPADDQYIQMKFRQAPFSVSMKWLRPASTAGQEVVYVHGKNNNQLRVHNKGILGVAGFVVPGTRVDVMVILNEAATSMAMPK